MSEEIIDRGALQRLLDVIGGDPEDLQELVEEFENTTPGLLQSMQDAIFCLSIAAYRRKLPRLGRKEILFFLYWAVLAGILQRMTTFVATEHVEAAMLSLIVTLQGIMVFAFAALPRWRGPRRAA